MCALAGAHTKNAPRPGAKGVGLVAATEADFLVCTAGVNTHVKAAVP